MPSTKPSSTTSCTGSWGQARLEAGARVADIGHGAATVLMAQAWPASSFTGFDYHPGSIEEARKRAAEAGAADRVGFEAAPADAYPGKGYDLASTFDALHDTGDPGGASRPAVLVVSIPHAGAT